MSTRSYSIQKSFFPVADTDFNISTLGFQDADPEHRHKAIKQEHVLQYVLDGRGYFEIGGKTFRVAAGDLFYLPKNVLVCYYADRREPYRYYWIEIDGASAKQLIGRAGLSAEHPVAHYADVETENYFRKMEPLIREDTFTGYLAAKGLAFGLFARLLSFHEENVHKLRPPAVEYVEKAIRYVKDNFGDDIGVSDMAAAVGVGRSYLCILFKKLTSVSPVEYLISYRIGQAEKMLASGLSVTETALSCGFNSPAHFCVQFKKRTGRTPSRYPEKDL